MPLSPTPEPPPASSQPAGTKRTAPERENSGSLPDAKRFKFDPSVSAPAGEPGTGIPDTFHFAISGELTPSRVENIRAWVYTNRPEKVMIWYDKGASLLSRLNRKIVEKAFLLSKGKTLSVGSTTLRDRTAFYNALRVQRKRVVERIPDLSASGNNLSRELSQYLVRRLGDNPEEIDVYLSRQQRLLNELESLVGAIPGTDVTICAPDQLRDRANLESIKRTEFELGNLQQANDFITVTALEQEGGFGIDSRQAPALKDDTLFANSNALANQLELNEQQKKAFRYFKTQEALKSDPNVRVDAQDYTRPLYGELLPPELESQVIVDVTAAGSSPLTEKFHSLDRSSLANHENALILPSAELALSERPVQILAGTKKAQALTVLKEDMKRGLGWSRNYIKKIIDESGLVGDLLAREVGKFESGLEADFRGRHPQATDAEVDDYLRVVEGEYSATYLDLDRRGVLTGPVSWNRRKTGTAAELNSASNPYTTAMDQEGTGGFNPFVYEDLKSHDRQVIITVPNKESLPKEPGAHPERFDPSLLESDGFRFDKHPQSSYWVRVDESRPDAEGIGALVYVDGDEFVPGANSKAVVSGHGGGRQSNDQANTDLGGYSPKELARVVFKALGERATKIGSIVFKGCRLACLPSVVEGQNILADDAFAVEFYREIKRLNIDAGKVVVSSASVVTDPAGINAYQVIDEVSGSVRLVKYQWR